MNSFWQGFEKRASVTSWVKNLKPVKWYTTESARPVFKIKKNLARGAVGLGAGGYAFDKFTSAPPEVHTPAGQQQMYQQMQGPTY